MELATYTTLAQLWQNFYSWHDPVIFSLFGISLRWYGLMYVLALLITYIVGKYLFVKKHKIMKLETYDNTFIIIDIGIILGARLGYVLFYDNNPWYYIMQPWQIFNPFNDNGDFVGISGLSYHGATIGFVIGTWYSCNRYKVKFLVFMDLMILSASAGYFFGRVGNFLNGFLVGRETDVPWAVFSHGALRHPALLYEAILEGLVTFLILWWLYQRKSFDGQIMTAYGLCYASFRFIAEFYRQPDQHLGFVAFNWMTMGQVLSIIMAILALSFYFYCHSLSLTKTKTKQSKRKQK